MTKLKRDAAFWTIAGQATILNFYLGGFGPAQPLLRAEQHTSLTVAGLHGTMMGLAAIIGGAMQPNMVHKFGRRKSSWIGLTVFAIGVPFFALGNSIYMTLPAVLFSCIGFNFVILNMVTQLSHHYPDTPDLAVSQSNAINAIGYVLGTLVVGSLATWGISWRLGLLLCIPAAIAIYIFGRDQNLDSHDHSAPKQSGKLSASFWIAWIGFFATISSEFSISFWAATLISNRTGAAVAISTLCITAFGSGMGLGRWFIPILLRNFSLDFKLKAILIIQLMAFFIFWFSHNLQLSLFALFLIGLGISGQFSMTSVRLIKLSNNRPDLAVGKSAYAAGIAIGLAPFLLAFMGDRIGISRAYLMVPLLIAISMGSVLLVSSEAHQKP